MKLLAGEAVAGRPQQLSLAGARPDFTSINGVGNPRKKGDIDVFVTILKAWLFGAICPLQVRKSFL